MTAISTLGLSGTPVSKATTGRYDGKTVAAAFQSATLIWQFDLWRAGYAGAIVEIFKAGTTTRADVYEDINLTEPADNPQVLLTQTINSETYGKFITSLYTADSYYIVIDGVEESGVQSPAIRSLASEDGSDMFVTSDKGGIERTAGQRAGDTIHVLDFGNFLEIDGSTSENTETLTAALGVASAANGGEVILPAGTYKITTFNLPANVILRGQGRNATVLQSEEADLVCTVTGSNAGLAYLTLDGINLNPGSVGLYAIGRDEMSLTETTIKRFEIGVKAVGGSDHHYTNLFTENCGTCVELRGDNDASNTDEGAAFTDLTWRGGSVKESTTYGLYLRQIDADLDELTIADVLFEDNVGTAALYIQGAEHIIFEDCTFTNNTIRHLLTADSTNNDVENVQFVSCSFIGDEIKLAGSCRDFVFDRPILESDLSINLDSPENPIMFRDATEAVAVTSTGATEKLSRWQSIDAGVYEGQTTASVSTATVFKRILEPGEVVHMELFATAVQLNVAAFGTIKKTAAAYCPAATLDFDGQTSNFTLGNTLTGGTSGATGILQAQADGGATGTASLIRLVAGATTGNLFQNNEALTGSGGGAAVVDGSITYQNAVQIGPVQIDHYGQSAGATTWDIDVTTSGREVRVKVVGPTTGTIDWNVMVRQNDVR